MNGDAVLYTIGLDYGTNSCRCCVPAYQQAYKQWRAILELQL